MKLLLLALAVPIVVAGGPSCDNALGEGLCPDAFTLEETGTCLIAKKAEVDADCALFIEINEACASALGRCGDGIAWGSDAMLCVTQWTRADDHTADCADALAKVEVPEEIKVVEEESEATKAKKAKRKAARKRATNDVKKLNAEKEREARQASEAKEKKAAKKAAKKGKTRRERMADDEEL